MGEAGVITTGFTHIDIEILRVNNLIFLVES